jgi:imidazolonepropionase-like amidohydrolase
MRIQMRVTVAAWLLGATSGLAAQTYDKLSGAVQGYVAVKEPVVALTNVRIIDGTGAPAKEGQTIVMDHGRITAVGATGSVNVPNGAKVIDYAGHTVIPGIVGMHDHIHYSAAGWRNINLAYSSPRLYLASGVTTIRTTGSLAPYEDLNLMRDISKGTTVGPKMHFAGPYLTGPNPALGVMGVVATEEEARRAVRYWVQEGATWFKLYTTIRRAEMRALIDEAHKLGVKVTGHLCSIGFREAAELGIDNLDHGLFVNTEYDPKKVPDQCPATNIKLMETLDIGSADVQSTFKLLIDKHIPMTSTLPVIEAIVPGRPKDIDPRTLELMYPAIKDAYLKMYDAMKANPNAGVTEAAWKKALAYEYAFVKAGGLLGAGVDNTGNGGALAGLGDQRNFGILLEAGFTPVEVIQIMTLNGAKILGLDKEIGSIEVGKAADLVVINGNPLVDDKDMRKVVVTFKDGVGYDPEKLFRDVRGVVGLR